MSKVKKDVVQITICFLGIYALGGWMAAFGLIVMLVYLYLTG